MDYVDNPRFSDLRILAGPDRVPLHAHRVVLCMASGVFRDMLDHASFGAVGDTLEAPLFGPEELRVLLRHAYTGGGGGGDVSSNAPENIGLSTGNVTAVDAAADYYAMPSLHHRCRKLLRHSMDEHNAVHVLMQIPRDSKLYGVAVERMMTMDASKVDDLESMELDDVDAILGGDSATLRSYMRLALIWRWCAGRDVHRDLLVRWPSRMDVADLCLQRRHELKHLLREHGLNMFMHAL